MVDSRPANPQQDRASHPAVEGRSGVTVQKKVPIAPEHQ